MGLIEKENNAPTILWEKSKLFLLRIDPFQKRSSVQKKKKKKKKKKHYETTPLKIFWKFYHQKLSFQIKIPILFIFLFKT